MGCLLNACFFSIRVLPLVAVLLTSVRTAISNPNKNQYHRHARGGGNELLVGTPHFCMREKVFRIDDNAVALEDRGWMARRDLEKTIVAMDALRYPYVTVTIDGIPCVEHECCTASLMIRPGRSSDVEVLTGIIDNYSRFLTRLLPWQPQAILEGGGNIGVATILLAHMYPRVPIVVLEPEPANCWLLQANTRVFANVRVKCAGLWDKVANLSIEAAGDGREWGWRTVEVPQATASSIPATSVPALLQEFNLSAFDYAKIDIEGAEFAVLKGDSARSWLPGAKVLSLETHKALAKPGEVEHLKNLLINQGFQWSTSGEYDVWATAELQKRIVPA